MKKLKIIACAVIAAALTACSSGAEGQSEPPATKDLEEPVLISNIEEVDMEEKRIFFSPQTGSDEGDGSMSAPVMSEEKAREIAEKTEVGDGEKLILLEYVMTVNVKTEASAGVNGSLGINMIPFTASADGYYFKGESPIKGCDTQRYFPDGTVEFSARYILKGVDCDGKPCSIFIENNGPALDKCTPEIVTDSEALSWLSDGGLRAIVVPVDGGVDVNVYKIINI